MRRLIRQRQTGLFLTKQGGWTSDFRQAMVLADLNSICAEIERLDLKEVESVLVLSENPLEFHGSTVLLPLLDPTTGRPWLTAE